MPKKARNDIRKLEPGVRRAYDLAGNLVEVNQSNRYVGTFEECDSSEHRWLWWQKFKRQYGKQFPHVDRLDVGGYFHVRRVSLTHTPAHISIRRKYGGGQLAESYDGQLIVDNLPTSPTSLNTLPQLISPLTMMGEGVKGWNRYKPTAQQNGIGQFLGELHQLPINPSRVLNLMALAREFKQTFGKRSTNLGDLGSAYLSVEFGWKPFLSDLRDLLKTALDVDKRIQQLARDNGRPVRRKGVIDQDAATTISSVTSPTGGGYTWPYLTTSNYAIRETRRIHTTTQYKYWFAGRFQYFIDPHREGYGPMDAKYRTQLSRIVYGLDPLDPSLIYELVPWSWLIDWIIPIGNMLDHWSNDAADRLVAHYAYVMGHKLTYTFTEVTGRLVNFGPYVVSSQMLTETKQRHVAHPFGFGVLDSGLSTKQVAILAALGLTKIR